MKDEQVVYYKRKKNQMQMQMQGNHWDMPLMRPRAEKANATEANPIPQGKLDELLMEAFYIYVLNYVWRCDELENRYRPE